MARFLTLTTSPTSSRSTGPRPTPWCATAVARRADPLEACIEQAHADTSEFVIEHPFTGQIDDELQ